MDMVLPHFKDYEAYEAAFPMPTETAAEPCHVDAVAVAASHSAGKPDDGHVEAEPDEGHIDTEATERMKKVCARLPALPWIFFTT